MVRLYFGRGFLSSFARPQSTVNSPRSTVRSIACWSAFHNIGPDEAVFSHGSFARPFHFGLVFGRDVPKRGGEARFAPAWLQTDPDLVAGDRLVVALV